MSSPDTFWSALPLGRGVTLIQRDANGLAAFDKPAGVLSHPNEPADERRSLLTTRYEVEGEFFEWPDTSAPGGVRRLWLLNRLDSATSGVILAADRAELAELIRAHFKRKEVQKVYQALVFGAPRQSPETWRDRLAVDKRAGRIRTAAHDGHVPAESVMRIVSTGSGEPRVTLLQLEPQTGRSHQLRVQCAKRHLPIVGDQTYGDFPRNRAFAKRVGTKRLFLHSMRTTFDYAYAGRSWNFTATAPLPAEFVRALSA